MRKKTPYGYVALTDDGTEICAAGRTRKEAHRAAVDGGFIRADFKVFPASQAVVDLAMSGEDVLFLLDDDGEVGLELTYLQGLLNEEDVDSVQAVLASGCNLDEVNFVGRGALHQAVSNEQASFVEMLIGAGATVDLQDDRGFTPLCGLFLISPWDKDAHASICNTLLAAGADPQLGGAIDLAEQAGSPLIGKLRLAAANLDARKIEAITPAVEWSPSPQGAQELAARLHGDHGAVEEAPRQIARRL